MKEKKLFNCGLKCERIVLANGERDTRLVEDPQAKPIWARYYDLKYCEPYVCDRQRVQTRIPVRQCRKA